MTQLLNEKQVASKLGRIVFDKEAHDGLLAYLDYNIEKLHQQLEIADISQFHSLQGEIRALKKVKQIKLWAEDKSKEPY